MEMSFVRKTILLLLAMVFALSFTVYAESISEATYSSFDGGSLIDFSIAGELGSKFVVKGTYSIVDTIIGDYNKFDILGGLKIDVEASGNTKKSKIYLLGGMRKSEFNTGLLLSADIRTDYSEKIFMHDTIEFVSWQDSDVTALASKFLLGYKIDEKLFQSLSGY